MNKIFKSAIAIIFLAGASSLAATDYESKDSMMMEDKGGMMEDKGAMMEDKGNMIESAAVLMSSPTNDDVRKAAQDFVAEQSKESGTLSVFDPVVAKERKLSFEKIQEQVGKTTDYYFTCGDFKDTESGEMIDLDFDVESKDGQLSVVGVRIHKVGGKERFTYDTNNNRVPMPEEAQEMMKEGSSMMEGEGNMMQENAVK